MLVRDSAKWRNVFRALDLANKAIGGPAARQFYVPDSEEPADLERSFSDRASDEERAYARKFLDYCFVGKGFDTTVDRGIDYYEGEWEVLTDDEIQRRRAALAELHPTLGL